MPKQCLIFWGREPVEGGGQFVFQAGEAPSRATVRFRLGAKLQQFGDLTITDGSRTIRLQGCRLVRAPITSGGGGRYQEATIEDRRWKWAYSRIWGDYNNVEHNIVIARTRKSARALARECMEALGETKYNVDALPDDAYPATEWSAESAGAALVSLCEQFGCLVAPAFSGTIVVYRDGDGRRPPIDVRAMDSTLTRDPPVVPDQLVFEGGETLWQHDLFLKPMGFESFSDKAEVKSIYDLTYRPNPAAADGGWGFEDPNKFLGVTAKKRELAKGCVWKLYQVEDNFQLRIPPSALPNGNRKGRTTPQPNRQTRDYYQIKTGELWRILPLETLQLSMFKKAGKEEGPAAQVLGYFRDEKHGMSNNSTTPIAQINRNRDISFPDTVSDELVYEGGFSIDALHGYVKFSNPVFYNFVDAGQVTHRIAPYIRLRTSFPLRDRDSLAPVSQQYWFAPPRSSKQGITEVVKLPESIYEIAPNGQTNVSDYVAQAKIYLQEHLNSYYTDDAISVPYKGFVFDVELDGAIRSITWAVDPEGAGTTQIEYLNDRPDLRISNRDLRARIQTANLVKQAAAAKRAAQVAAKKNGPILRNGVRKDIARGLLK